MNLDELVGFVTAEVDERLFATGGQLYVSVGAEPLVDVGVGVDGVDRPVTEDTLFSVYCAGKPVFAVAVGALVDDGELSFDDRIGDVVDRPLHPEVGDLLVGQLLDHSAGLHDLDTFTYLGSSARVQEALVLSCRPPIGWRVGQHVGYCQITAWELLRMAVEDLTGQAAPDFVTKRILEPLGADTDVFIGGMSDAQFDRHRDRFGINIHLSGLAGDPMLTERNRRFRCVRSIAGGSSASARGLGRFYEALLGVAGGADGIVSAACLGGMTARQSGGVDALMGRECSYGHGFMVDLAGHDFGRRCGPGSFGHSGYGGMSVALCDPEVGLVVAFHFNGRVDSDTAVRYRRPALIDNIYRAVEELV